MNEQRIQELKNALRELVSLIASRGGPIPDDLKVLLAQAMEHVANRIQQIRQEGNVENLPPEQPPGPPQAPQLDQGPYPSSNVNSYKYNPDTQQLWVKFHGKDSADSGPTYQYSNVPRFIYDVFNRGGVAPRTSGQNRYHRWIRGVTPSLGASLYALIRDNYPYQRMS